MASGGNWGADDQIVPQLKEVVRTGDSSSSSGNKKPLTSSDRVHSKHHTIAARRSCYTDDTVPVAFSTQPNGGFSEGNQLVLGATMDTSCYKITSTDNASNKFCCLCSGVLEEQFITSCCGQAYCYKCRDKGTVFPLCHRPVPTYSTYPAFGATCRFNQKERNVVPCLLFLPHSEEEQVVPTKPAPVTHPWIILPFPHDSTIDHIVYQQLQLFENDQDVSFYDDQDQYGRGGRDLRWPECQICWDGRVKCIFMPCGHARTCQACGNQFIGQPCPFCRKMVHQILRIYL